MKMLAKCQANYMQVVLQKIDRKSKPIKKHSKICEKYLEKKGFRLEDEKFDLYSYLENQELKK